MKKTSPRKKWFLFLLLLLSCGMRYSYAGSLEEDILKYTNEYRRSKGKPALQTDPAATTQAAQHSRNMAKGKTAFGHDGFKERVDAVSRKSGPVSAAAENVAYGQLDAEQVVKGWIKSKVHRKNMLGDYNRIGIGAAKSRDGTLYFTQLFIKQ